MNLVVSFSQSLGKTMGAFHFTKWKPVFGKIEYQL